MPKSIQAQKIIKRKRSYDIINSPLVSINDDDGFALSGIMITSNTSKPNGYQNFSILDTSTVEQNGTT